MPDKSFKMVISMNLEEGAPIQETRSDSVEVLFCVNAINNVSYIKEVAIELLNRGIRRFNFTGKYRDIWEITFDEADIELHPDNGYDEVALTASYDNIEDFHDIPNRSEQSNIYIFYDREQDMK